MFYNWLPLKTFVVHQLLDDVERIRLSMAISMTTTNLASKAISAITATKNHLNFRR